MSEPVTLRTLLGRLSEFDASRADLDSSIVSLEIDSRRIASGALFVALRGEHVNGHDFIREAAERGAVAVLAERSAVLPAFQEEPPYVFVEDTRQALSSIASIFFGDPSQAISVTGVTGTNGKTTTTHMIEGIFRAAGIPCGVIGTMGAHMGEREWKLANTTPLAPELQQLLAEMRDAGARSVAMEVSSHALALDRVNDVHFAVGAFTNLTRDHLDFHETFEAYASAKKRLFDMSERCVFNVDDAYGERWAAEFAGEKPTVTYGMRNSLAELSPSELELRGNGSTFVLEGTRFDVRVPGNFNVSNALCAIGCARQLGIDDATCARGLGAVERVPGRMEHVFVAGAAVDAVVDYAHTPDSLENTLQALRAGIPSDSSLAVVFGCGGNRDRGKRPLMGEIALRLADRVYVTNDNPRTEDPAEIAREILGGAKQPVVVELDRQKAIERAITEARAGDTVLIAGKGHEDYQIIGDTVYQFDDVMVARQALAKRSGNRAQ